MSSAENNELVYLQEHYCRGSIHSSPPDAEGYTPDPRPHLTVEMRGKKYWDMAHVGVPRKLLEVAGLVKSRGKGGKK